MLKSVALSPLSSYKSYTSSEPIMARGNANHFQGGKVTASHTTIIDAARRPVIAAEKLSCVTKVSLGMIKVIPRGTASIKYLTESEGCILAKVRGTTSIQEIRIYCSNPELVKEQMSAALA